MSETLHTPGPWSYNQHNLTVIAGDMRICDIRGWGYLTGAGAAALHLPASEAVVIQEANAQLIVAAPALLAACQLFIAHEDSEDLSDYLARANAASAAIRAAVANALGGTRQLDTRALDENGEAR